MKAMQQRHEVFWCCMALRTRAPQIHFGCSSAAPCTEPYLSVVPGTSPGFPPQLPGPEEGPQPVLEHKDAALEPGAAPAPFPRFLCQLLEGLLLLPAVYPTGILGITVTQKEGES